MVQFLNSTQARGEIERIISNARYDMSMISPFIKINDDFISRITDACMSRNVNVVMVCREKDLNPIEREKLENIPNLALHFNERVHAKCFYNEDTMVITSLNLYNSSFGENREMGVLLKSTIEGDKEAFEEAKKEAQFILREFMSDTIQHKQKETISPPKPKNEIKSSDTITTHKQNKRKGSIIENIISEFIDSTSIYVPEAHCIHCGETIPYNLEAPYCPKCFRTWVKYKNDDYKEKYCFKCGKRKETSKRHPLCTTCDNKYT